MAGVDLARLPYPVALTTERLREALDRSSDVLRTLFLLKDVVETGLKYVAAVLLVEYLRSPACTPERNETLLKKLLKPTLGAWVGGLIDPLSRWLLGTDLAPGARLARGFVAAAPKGKPSPTPLLMRCNAFVEYRNDTLGHGAQRPDEQYRTDLGKWLSLVPELLDAVAGLAPDWRLLLPTHVDRAQVWMGPRPPAATEPGSFAGSQVGRFVLRGPSGEVRELYPFLAHLPASGTDERRLHYHDSFTSSGRGVIELEYDEGFKQAFPEPVEGFRTAFTAESLRVALDRYKMQMVEIEGRILGFGELIEREAEIVGRRFAIDRIRRFLDEHDRGLLVIVAEPGKGKTALMAHLIDRVFGHVAPPPVPFFYRRTAGITSPDVAVKSLYHELLDKHNLTESEEASRQTASEEVFAKLNDLLKKIAERLTPGRPQLIFIDALDEAEARLGERSAFNAACPPTSRPGSSSSPRPAPWPTGPSWPRARPGTTSTPPSCSTSTSATPTTTP